MGTKKIHLAFHKNLEKLKTLHGNKANLLKDFYCEASGKVFRAFFPKNDLAVRVSLLNKRNASKRKVSSKSADTGFRLRRN